MRGRVRAHLTYANLASSLALFIALAGGTAWAVNEWTGANIVDASLTSADYKNNDIRSADVKEASLGNGDFVTGSVDSRVATNNSLTGGDIADQSGVDTCTHGTARFGELCVGVANEHHNWSDALNLCGSLQLRLPSLGEALSLAASYDLPSVDQNEHFWTEQFFWNQEDDAWVVSDDTNFTYFAETYSGGETVCVTTPTN